MRRIVACVAGAAAGLGLVSMAVAPAASAATVNITIDCQGNTDVNASAGDTVVITMSSACLSGSGVVYNGSSPWPSSLQSGFFDTPIAINNSVNAGYSWVFAKDWYAYSNGTGNTQVIANLLSTNGLGQSLEVGSTLAVVGPTGASLPFLLVFRGPGGAPDQPIPMWVQAFARNGADAACPDGWTASWDQWPNDGKGGYVCQRSIKSFGE